MIQMRRSRVLIALPILVAWLMCAQILGETMAPSADQRGIYASVSLLVAVALVAVKLPVLFEFVAAKDDTGSTGARAQVLLARLAYKGVVPFLPRLHVVDSKGVSAISFGTPKNGVIFITRELVDRMDDEAVEVTLVHELHHLAKRHALFHYAFVLTMIFLSMVLVFRAPWLGPVLLLGYLAVLRHFEYMADRGAALALGSKQVARGLGKVQAAVREKEFGPLQEFFLSTHPPFGKRIARVLALGAGELPGRAKAGGAMADD